MSVLPLMRLAGNLVGSIPDLLEAKYTDPTKLVNKKLHSIVKHSYENVPLYQNKYRQAGVSPSDIHSIEDIVKLPIITKKDIVEGFPDAIIAKTINPRHCHIMATSGSTGSPVKLYKDRTLIDKGLLVSLTMHRTLGKYLGIKLGRSTVSIVVTAPDSLEAVVADETKRLPHFLTKSHRLLDALDDPHEHIRLLAEYKPDIVSTYPSVMRNIAVVAREEGLIVYQPKLILLSGELITENTRNVISSVFHGEVINYYAATEAGIIALECKSHRGLHVRSGIILELLHNGKPVPPGSPGQVVVTDLRNKSTPIIRYSGLGDVAVFNEGDCSCGSKQPLLKMIEGRVIDSVVLPDGRFVHPFSLTLALEHISMIARFQIIQETLYHIRVLIVPERNEQALTAFGEKGQLRDKVVQNLKGILGEETTIHIELLNEIPRIGQAFNQSVVKSLVTNPVLSI